jgi:hypothetical protein
MAKKQKKSMPGKQQKITKAVKDRAKFQARAVQMYQNGQMVVDIAVAMGYERGQGQNRVANALLRAGMDKGERTA